MSVKKQSDWSKEKLKKWAKPVLKYPELVEIACTAASNTEAKDKALEFTKEEGLEEKVAMACRWLRILRAKLSEEEFRSYLAENYPKQEKKEMIEKVKGYCVKCRVKVNINNLRVRSVEGGDFVCQGECSVCGQYVAQMMSKETVKKLGLREEETEKKDIRTVEFQLPENTKLIQHAGDKFNNIFISFSRKQKAIKFCNDLLEEITGIHIPSRKEEMEKLFEYDAEEEAVLLKLLIRVLEEKFGLEPFIEVLEKNGITVKICGNCEYCLPQHDPNHMGFCLHKRDSQKLFEGACYIDNGFESCEHWIPKEVSGKEKVCRTCACGTRVGEDLDKNESFACGVYGLKQCVVSGQCEQWKESK